MHKAAVLAAEMSVLTGVWPWHYYQVIKLADLISFSESKKMKMKVLVAHSCSTL